MKVGFIGPGRMGQGMARVEAGRWQMRDPRSMTTAILSAPDK